MSQDRSAEQVSKLLEEIENMKLLLNESLQDIQREEQRADALANQLREKELTLTTCLSDLNQLRAKASKADLLEERVEKMCEVVNETKEKLEAANEEVNIFFKKIQERSG